MASANSWKLRALMKKNLLILRRNVISTIFEILFPILLIIICYAIRQAFTLKTFLFVDEEKDIVNYIQNKSVIYKDDSNVMDLMHIMEPETNDGLSIIPALKFAQQLIQNINQGQLLLQLEFHKI